MNSYKTPTVWKTEGEGISGQCHCSKCSKLQKKPVKTALPLYRGRTHTTLDIRSSPKEYLRPLVLTERIVSDIQIYPEKCDLIDCYEEARQYLSVPNKKIKARCFEHPLWDLGKFWKNK